MPRFIDFAAALSLCATPGVPSIQIASASGGWVSGGGELIRDAQNPWFIQNTEKVNYCIEVDPDHFDAPREMIGEKVRAALDIWKKEFSYNKYTGDVRIATQDFYEVDCGQDVDVHFQFGTLTKEQQERIEDPRSFVSLAVRTGYDTVNMRGKGFVYIAPDSGPLRPDSPDMMQKPWQAKEGSALYAVLIHELGHVFGIPHVGTGFMGARFPMAVTSKGFISLYPNYGTDDFHFFSPMEFTNTMFSQSLRGLERYQEFFGVSSQARKIIYHFKSNQLEVSEVLEGNDKTPVVIGRAELTETRTSPLLMSMQVYLPPEQKALSFVSSGIHTAAMQRVQNRTGIYKSVDGTIERPVFITLPSEGSEGAFMGVLDGQLIPDLLDLKLLPVK